MNTLTKSQAEALLIVVARDPEITWSSNSNGKSYIHRRSADVLERLGLIRVVVIEGKMRFRFGPDQYLPTDEGRKVAESLR